MNFLELIVAHRNYGCGHYYVQNFGAGSCVAKALLDNELKVD